MLKILIIGIIIVLIILVLSVMTINKGYSYKHSLISQKITLIQKTVKSIHNILRIFDRIALSVIIISAIGSTTGQNNFLPLSQFLLGALMFLIAIEQIKKKDSGTGFICIVAGAFIWLVFIITYIK